MSTTDLFLIVLSLFFSGAWLIYNLYGFQWLPKINDKKGVIIPSFIFLSSPFIAIWAKSILTHGGVDGIIRSLIPLITFIAGQRITKREKQEEIKKQEIALATMLIFQVEENIIQALSAIERELTSGRNNNEVTLDKLRICCDKYNTKIEELYNKFSFQLEVTKTNSGLQTLSYLKETRDCLERITATSLTSEDRSYYLSEIRVYKIQGYANIITLIKELISNNELLHERFLNGYIRKLKQELKRLLLLRNIKKTRMKYWQDKSVVERENHPDGDLYFRFDIDTEDEAIEGIETIFEFLGITI